MSPLATFAIAACSCAMAAVKGGACVVMTLPLLKLMPVHSRESGNPGATNTSLCGWQKLGPRVRGDERLSMHAAFVSALLLGADFGEHALGRQHGAAHQRQADVA